MMDINKAYKVIEAEFEANPGDTFIVTHKVESNTLGWDNTWVEEMDEFVGCRCVVKCQAVGKGITLYKIDESGEPVGCSYTFPFFVLSDLIEANPEEVYALGQYFMQKSSSCIYMIAQVAEFFYSLVNLTTGNRYDEISSTMAGVFHGDRDQFIKIEKKVSGESYDDTKKELEELSRIAKKYGLVIVNKL